MPPCVTALADAFCKLRGVPTCTQVRMCVQLDCASMWFKLFNLISGRKMQFIVFMLRVVRTHFIPAKALKPFSAKGSRLARYRGTICRPFPECELYKMPQKRADILISQASAFCSGELSPNKYNVPVGLYHAPNSLTWRWYSRANVPCFNFLHCPLSAGEILDI